MNNLLSASSATLSRKTFATGAKSKGAALCALYLLAQLASGVTFADEQIKNEQLAGEQSKSEQSKQVTKPANVPAAEKTKATDLSTFFDYTPLSFNAPPDSDPFTPRFFAIDIAKRREGATLCWQEEELPAQNLLPNVTLESISFRGSIQDKNGIWALINASDGLFYKIGVGQVLGSSHGKIDFISQSQVTVTEYVSNAPDCWHPRTINWTLNR